MKTAIVTDSNSGISDIEAEIFDIHVIPMPVIINDKIFFEGIDIQTSEFFRRLQNKENISTSQPSPGDVATIWEALLKQGYNDLVYIPMSSGLSSSCATACALAQEYGEKVCVVDARRISVTQRHIVLDAVKLREQGASAVEICQRLEENAEKSRIYVGVDDLWYLKRGGRIIPAAATMATVLNIKPLLVIQGEKIDLEEKARGVKACQRKMLEKAQKYCEELLEKGAKIRFDVGGSFTDPEDADAWLRQVQQTFPHHSMDYYSLTFSISCHTGPNAFGLGISAQVP